MIPVQVVENVLSEGLALVFDLDGVIVDSTPVHTEAWRVYLNGIGLECANIERRMHGRRNDEIVADFIGANLSAEKVYAHGAAKEAVYRRMMAAQLELRLVPGVKAFLESFQRFPLGLGSNAEPANVDFVLDGAGLRPFFRTIVDGHQVERPKPDPEVYLRVARQLDCPPANCIVFEDSAAGVEAARLAGARVVGVRTAEADLGTVDFSVRDFSDPALPAWLGALEPRA